MGSFGNQYPEEGTLAWELGVLRFPFPRLPFRIWLIICSGLPTWQIKAAGIYWMPIMYCCFFFFFLRCGLKCRRGRRLWKNVNCTKGTNFEGQVLDSFHQPTPSKNICPFAASICFHFCSFFFFYFLLLSAVWNSASWRWACNNMYPFWNKMCRLWKDWVSLN